MGPLTGSLTGAALAALPAERALALLAGAGEDGLRPDLEPTDVTPGVVGFAVTAIVVAGLIGLLLSMVVKLRKVNLGAEQPERRWATPADTDDATRDDRPGDAPPGGAAGPAGPGDPSGGTGGPDR
jgi:hypothetical protein